MIGELTIAQEERREKILNSATSYFAKNGFYAADMDKIAKNAGVGKGTLYNYFKNKDDLYLNCVEHHFEKTLSFIDSRTSNSETTEEFINNYLDASIEYFSTNLDSFDLLIRSNSDLLDEVINTMDGVKEKYYKNFKEKIKSVTTEKKLNPQIVLLALDASTTFIMFRQFKKHNFEINEVKETLRKLFLTGLIAKE
jgi:AcrR family transcriptional regulator